MQKTINTERTGIMVSDFELKIGDIVTDCKQQKSYRVIHIDETNIELCLLNTNKLIFMFIPIVKLVSDIHNNLFILEHEDYGVVNVDNMSDMELKRYKRNKQITQEITNLYGPTFELLSKKVRKPELKELISRYQIDEETLRRLYIRYIQSGFNEISLLDKRTASAPKEQRADYKYKKRPGRKSSDDFASKVILNADVRNQFDAAIKERKNGRCKSYDSAYSWMINKYYSETFVQNGTLVIQQKKESKIPSLKQFMNYVRKNVSKKEMDIADTSLREVKNDKRLLLSDSFNDVLGPGDLCEIDAVEVDVSLVSSSDRKQAIGRPIMYLMIDVYTRMILAMSVSLHNNSMIALTNLFLNLSDDKKEFCAKYDHSITDDAWISNIIPRRIRVDRGADFASNQFGEICQELGITRDLVPAAMGSLKGSIEQEFRTLHAAQKPHLDGKGVITKRYDSNHHKQAVLTIEEYTKMAVDFVLHHNLMACTNYPYTADMVKNGVHAIPAELWAYGAKMYGQPRPIVNIDAFRYSLMKKATGKLDRTGLTVNNLSYINLSDKDMLDRMYELQNKREKFEVRIDPRDISNVYYLKNGKLMVAQLNPAKTANIGYQGMTLFELEEYNKKEKALKKEAEARNRRAKNSLHAAQEAIVQEALAAKPDNTPNNTKDMRIAREAEKQRIAKENSIASRMQMPQLPQIAPVVIDTETAEVKEVETATENPSIPVSPTAYKTGLAGFEEAMSAFMDEEDDE